MNMGYAEYVWTSYAVFVLGLVWCVISPMLKHRRVQREVQDRAAGERL